MNIAIVSYIYPRKTNPSQGLFVHQQAKYMAKAGNHVDIITTKGSKDKKQEKRDSIDVYRVSDFSKPKYLSGLFLLLFAFTFSV